MNQETEKVIREYRFTVIFLGGVIVFCMLAQAFFLLKYMPDITYKMAKQALNEVYDERIELAQ